MHRFQAKINFCFWGLCIAHSPNQSPLGGVYPIPDPTPLAFLNMQSLCNITVINYLQLIWIILRCLQTTIADLFDQFTTNNEQGRPRGPPRPRLAPTLWQSMNNWKNVRTLELADISSSTLKYFLLIAFHTLSLFHFPVMHFPPLRYAPAFSTPAFSAPPPP